MPKVNNSRMTLNEALQVLGIEAEDSSEKVKERHKMLCMENHPDRGGNTDDMARINIAKDIILDNLSIANSQGELLKVEQMAVMKYSQITRQAAQTEKKVRRHTKGVLKNLEYFSYAVAAFSAYVMPMTDRLLNETVQVFPTVLMALCGLTLHIAVHKRKQKVESFENKLIQKSQYVQVLRSIFKNDLDRGFTFENLQTKANSNLTHDLSKIIHIVGVDSFCQLLILKGQENFFLGVEYGEDYIEHYKINTL